MSSQESSVTVNAGDQAVYHIDIWFPYNWTTEMGHFIVHGLPSGTSYSTDVSYITPSGNGVIVTVNFTISTSTSTPQGTYTLTFIAYTYNHTSGNWGNLSASTQATLVVNAPVPEFSTTSMLPLLIFLTAVIALWRRRKT